jgi:hypothetical protein
MILGSGLYSGKYNMFYSADIMLATMTFNILIPMLKEPCELVCYISEYLTDHVRTNELTSGKRRAQVQLRSLP